VFSFLKSKLRGIDDSVLVIGDAHIDVIADYRPGSPYLDKQGEVRYGIGGTAFNIAINLGQHGVPATLLAVLKLNSFSSVWIEERLCSANVNRQLLEFAETPESGFIAIRKSGELETAVTAAAIAGHPINHNKLKYAISRCRFVVADCNVSGDQLRAIVSLANQLNKQIAVSATSDSKVKRLLMLGSNQLIDILFLNEKELCHALGLSSIQGIDSEFAENTCTTMHSSSIVMTMGSKGYCVLYRNGNFKLYSAPDVERVVSTSGAGDALASGILKSWYENRMIDFDAAYTDVASLVTVVLENHGATVSSLAKDTEFSVLAKIANSKQPLWKRLLSQEVGVAVATLSFVTTVGFFALEHFFPRTPKILPSKTNAQGLPISKKPFKTLKGNFNNALF
jgi:sugar/nucleoside kinase (ribokinase family)